MNSVKIKARYRQVVNIRRVPWSKVRVMKSSDEDNEGHIANQYVKICNGNMAVKRSSEWYGLFLCLDLVE